MSIRGSNFENQHPFASDHALVWASCIPDGLLYGVDMSFTSTLFTLGPGFMLVAGRMFEITAAENISISPGSGYARVYVAIDTGAAATENSFNQVSFGVDYAANLDSFTDLTRGAININQGAAVYQAEVAVLAIDITGATAIERQMELVSPGAGTGAFATISVTYPAGSTVTVTDGKITYTATNTSGAALFIIPYAATWIVTATDGTETASETVNIITEGQTVSVELSYRLWLFKDGDLCEAVTGGWISTYAIPAGRSRGPTTIGEVLTCDATDFYDCAILGTDNAIDLTKINTLYVNTDDSSYGVQLRLAVGTTKSIANTTDMAAKVDFTSAGMQKLDVSALSGNYYVSLSATSSSNATSLLKAKKVWGE